MQYLDLFDTASHAGGRGHEGHLVVKTLLHYSLITLLKTECYEFMYAAHTWWNTLDLVSILLPVDRFK